MPIPYANKLWCSDETDESGLDDIYLVCFVGRPNPPQPFLIGVGPGNYWNSMEEGNKLNKRKTTEDVSINEQLNLLLGRLP